MRVTPVSINTNCRKPNFEAKFSQKEIQNLIISATSDEKAAGIPQLYTLLKHLAWLPGKIAKFADSESIGHSFSKTNKRVLLIDSKPQMYSDYGWESDFGLLKKYLVGEKSTMDVIRMPNSVFEREWWENRNVAADDLKELVLTI